MRLCQHGDTLTIRPAQPSDRDAIWSILEPVIRTGDHVPVAQEAGKTSVDPNKNAVLSTRFTAPCFSVVPRGQGPDEGREENGAMIIEIRAAEGGDDAKLLVGDQLAIYARVAARRGL